MEKKHVIRAGIAGVAGAVILGAGAFFMTHVSIDKEFFSKNAAVYDLTDHALSEEQYLQICREYPDTRILWTVPFQGSRYPMDTEYLTVTALTEEDAQMLDYLPNLKQVDGTACPDLSALLSLQERRPECQVLYQVPVGPERCSSTATELTVSDADAAELAQALPLLPQLKTLNLEGALPEPEELLRLQESFTSVDVNFTMDVCGQTIASDVQSMDFTGIPVAQQELARILPLFPSVTEVNLTGTNLTDAELKALAGQFPDIFFLCTMDFAGKPYSTDTTEMDISKCAVSVEEVEALLPFFPCLKKLDMSHCGIDDETMDALNRRHPEVSIVWTMKIGLVTVRTDDTIFFPAGVSEYNMPDNEELQKLRYCTEMVAIDIGHTNATECDWVANMPHLKYLILADTLITDLTPLSNLKELIYLEIFAMDLDDYSPLLGCTALQDLNISSTFADPEPLSKMTWLHNLMWNYVLDDPEIRDEALKLEEQLPDTNVVLKSYRRNIAGLWRHIPNYYVFRDLLNANFFDQTQTYDLWGRTDAGRILGCDNGNARFAGDILAEIVRYRIDNNLPIVGIKNVGSEKAEILYQSLINARP